MSMSKTKKMDIIHVPGWVKDAQALAMLSERFVVTEDEPLSLEPVGLYIELTCYPSIRITQMHDPRETDDLVEQLAAITAAVGAWEHLPIGKDLDILDSIKAADVAFKTSCDDADAAMELTCQELLAARAELKEGAAHGPHARRHRPNHPIEQRTQGRQG